MQDWSLTSLQRWFQSAIQYPDHEAVSTELPSQIIPKAVSEAITRSRRLTSEQRLQIYQHAYFARLLECLEAEFPATRHAAGEDAFAGFGWGYLRASPSRSDSLADLGAGFADYLTSTRPPRAERESELDFADFLIDLARLERTYSEVFDGPGPETGTGLAPTRLARLSPEEFAACRLEFQESVRLLLLQFPCHEFASGVRHDQHPDPPAPALTRLVVFRRDYIVRRLTVATTQWEMLVQLQSGAAIGGARSSRPKCRGPR
ncbi:MAG: DNA-binding domain-containing protein [Planctomycetaceae bacterium]